MYCKHGNSHNSIKNDSWPQVLHMVLKLIYTGVYKTKVWSQRYAVSSENPFLLLICFSPLIYGFLVGVHRHVCFWSSPSSLIPCSTKSVITNKARRTKYMATSINIASEDMQAHLNQLSQPKYLIIKHNYHNPNPIHSINKGPTKN